MPPSRRDLLKIGGTGLATLATAGCLAEPGPPGAMSTGDAATTTSTGDAATTTSTEDTATTTSTDDTATTTSATEPASPTRSPESTHSTSTETPTAEERIVVALHNERDAEVAVSVTVVEGRETLAGADRTLPAGGYDAVFTNIREVGEYEATVETDDGVSGSFSFTIEEYDVRMGSNVVVWVGADDVEFGMEV